MMAAWLMAEENWHIEYLDCFNLSNIPVPAGEDTAETFQEATQLAYENLNKLWNESYAECFSQKSLVRLILKEFDCPPMEWAETEDPKPEEPYLGELFGPPPPPPPPSWVGSDAFLAHLKKHRCVDSPEQVEAKIRTWIEEHETEFQYPAAFLTCDGKDHGVACFTLKFSLEKGFVFEISGDY